MGVEITTFTTAPAVPGGVVAIICASLTTVRLVAAVLPMSTEVAPVSPDPEMVTTVPPFGGPDDGVMLLYAGPTYIYAGAADAAVPLGVTTSTHTVVPAVPCGVVAMTCESLTKVRPVAAVPPMSTEVAPVNPVPIIVTRVPPAAGPEGGVILANVGAGT